METDSIVRFGDELKLKTTSHFIKGAAPVCLAVLTTGRYAPRVFLPESNDTDAACSYTVFPTTKGQVWRDEHNPESRQVLYYGDEFKLISADGMSLCEVSGYICPRPPGTKGELCFSLSSTQTTQGKTAVHFLDHATLVVVKKGGKDKKQTVCNNRLTHSKVPGGYLTTDGAGHTCQFVLARDTTQLGTLTAVQEENNTTLMSTDITVWGQKVDMGCLPIDTVLTVSLEAGNATVPLYDICPPENTKNFVEGSSQFKVIGPNYEESNLLVDWRRTVVKSESKPKSSCYTMPFILPVAVVLASVVVAALFYSGRDQSMEMGVAGLLAGLPYLANSVTGVSVVAFVTFGLLFALRKVMRSSSSSSSSSFESGSGDGGDEYKWRFSVRAPVLEDVGETFRDKAMRRKSRIAVANMNANTLLVYQIVEGLKAAAKGYKDHRAGGKVSVSVSDPSYTVQSPSGDSSKGSQLVFVDHIPTKFGEIRKAHGISTEDYIQAWSYFAYNIPTMDTGAGRSGSLFLFSQDKKFVFKTLPKIEAHTLLNMIDDYANHVCKSADRTSGSRLMRYFALHSFTSRLQKDRVYIAVSENCFYSSLGREMELKYDLKGRVPKKPEHLRPQNPAKGNIWKDNQLKGRTFNLHPSVRQKVIQGLVADTKFLVAHDCIDYSLLVGVYPLRGEEEEVLEHTDLRCAAGTREVYRIGVIDFLATFKNWKKRSANFFKTFLWKEETLSTVPSQFYGDRFIKYLPTILPESKT